MIARERRTIAIGAAIVAVALFVTFGALPFARRWSEREALLAARVDRLARLRALVRDSASLAAEARWWQTSLASRPQSVVGARSAPLAAAALQSVLQDYATASQVQVTRVDVASVADSTTAIATIPATIAATGDVHGFSALLERIERGPRVLEIVDVAVQRTRGPRGEELLQFTIGVRAPFAGVE